MAEIACLRRAHAERHLQGLLSGPLLRTEIGDGGSGFTGWTNEASKINWRPYLRRGLDDRSVVAHPEHR